LWVPTYDGGPDAGDICVRRRGTHHRDQYPYHAWDHATALGAWGEIDTEGDPTKQLLAMFILFNTLTVREGIDVQKAHKAFLQIDEYRKAISPDAPGAMPDLIESD
jgi:hypothetical protein